MPQLDQMSHQILVDAGYEYDAKADKYFNRGQPSWEVGIKEEEGRRQGAFPSRTIEEFRAQESHWISEQKSKIKAMKATAAETV
jgi:hypothetical protein